MHPARSPAAAGRLFRVSSRKSAPAAGNRQAGLAAPATPWSQRGTAERRCPVSYWWDPAPAYAKPTPLPPPCTLPQTHAQFITEFFSDFLATDSVEQLLEVLRKAKLDARLLEFFPQQVGLPARPASPHTPPHTPATRLERPHEEQ